MLRNPLSLKTAPELVLGPDEAFTVARTHGVRLFQRCPPVHSIVLGRCRLQIGGRIETVSAIALPANTPHAVLEIDADCGGVAYLDPRRYGFADVERLAWRLRGFIPGQDDLRDAFSDALAAPRRRVDPRLLRALTALEQGATVEQAAAAVALSDSRLTHLMTETLGAPPRVWRAWLKLRQAIGATMMGAMNLTQAAHVAGFADSAHLTRTCKQLTGVRPAQMMPQTVYLSPELDQAR